MCYILHGMLKMRIFIAGSCVPALNRLIPFIVSMGHALLLYPERRCCYDHSGKNTLFPERSRREQNSPLEGRGVLGRLRAECVQFMAFEAVQDYEEMY